MEAEFEDYERNNKWNHIYQKIRLESTDRRLTNKESRKTENKALNRYRDVTPYDWSRIVLKRCNHDYINASLIKVESAQRQYILTQGPLQSTSGHFWLMIWEQNSKAILMLNKLVERGQIKCHQYWPEGRTEEEENEITFTDVELRVEFVDEILSQHFVTRKFKLTDLQSQESREILHFHYTSWPDFGLPESPASFLQYLQAVRESGALDMKEFGPPVIHCSAGIGRSGTFCLVDTCLVLIEQYGRTDAVNVIDILLDMRKYRMGLIQTAEQLRFSYMAIIMGAKQFSLTTAANDSSVPFSANNNCINSGNAVSPKIKRSIAIIDKNCENGYHFGDNDIESDDKMTNDLVLEDLCSTRLPPLPPRSRRSQSTTSQSGSGSGSTSPEPDSKRTKSSDSQSLSSVPQTQPLTDMISTEDKTSDSNSNANHSELTNNNSNNSVTVNQSERQSTTDHNYEVRQRLREEKRRKTSETIERIKKRQKDSEDRSRLKKHLIKYSLISLGFVLLFGTGIFVYNSLMRGQLSVNSDTTVNTLNAPNVDEL